MYLCIHNLAPAYIRNYFTSIDSIQYWHSPIKQRRLICCLVQYNQYGLRSIHHYRVRLWNSIPNEIKDSQTLFTRVRYRTVPLRSVPTSGTERGCVHRGTEKIKRSVPKQVQKLGGTEKWTRNWNDTISYRSALVWTEVVRYRTAFRTCLVSTGDTKLISMTTFDVEVEIRPNCTSLILPIVLSFQNRSFTSTVYSS